MPILLADEPRIKGKEAAEEEAILQGIIEATQNWTPEAKQRAFREYKARIGSKRRVWYCMRGRGCDGEPHDEYNYPHARSDQWPPAVKFFVWALVGGRGSGKTRSGSEYIRKMTRYHGRIALVGATTADVRDTMITGESGLEAVFANAGEKIVWQPSKRLVTFPNGAIGKTYTGEEPDRLRGPQHGCAWLDEPAHFPSIDDVWSNLLLGLRIQGRVEPTIAVTTTPLPTEWMINLLDDPRTKSSRVSTYANLSNLADTFRDNVLAQYEGTRLGRQELHGELLLDIVGALWQNAMINSPDPSENITHESMDRIVVAIDPAGSTKDRADETGIVVVGKMGDTAYVIADYTDKYSPNGWAKKALWAYDLFGADALVAEKNFGGDMVEANLRTELKDSGREARIIITTASRSKELRAEPVVGLYEQGRVLHLRGLEKLEKEMLRWIPGKGKSPNRVDALVWAVTELIKPVAPARFASPAGRGLRAVGSTTPGLRRLPNGFVVPRRTR